jgi:hypothetical protein
MCHIGMPHTEITKMCANYSLVLVQIRHKLNKGHYMTYMHFCVYVAGITLYSAYVLKQNLLKRKVTFFQKSLIKK